MNSEITVTNTSSETIVDFRFVVLSDDPERGNSDVDGLFACALPTVGARARGVLGVISREILPGRSAECQIGGIARPNCIGEIRRGDLIAVSSDAESRGYAKRAEAGDEVVGLALANAGTRCAVLLGSRGVMPGRVK